MKVSIVFYRTRDIDAAHAIVGRETREAADIGDAVESPGHWDAPSQCPSFPMPWTSPTGKGATLYSGILDADGMLKDQYNDPDFS